jgi:hypothetical protein
MLQCAVIINLCIMFSSIYNSTYIYFFKFFFQFLVYQLSYQICTSRGVDLSVLVKYTTLVGASKPPRTHQRRVVESIHGCESQRFRLSTVVTCNLCIRISFRVRNFLYHNNNILEMKLILLILLINKNNFNYFLNFFT